MGDDDGRAGVVGDGRPRRPDPPIECGRGLAVRPVDVASRRPPGAGRGPATARRGHGTSGPRPPRSRPPASARRGRSPPRSPWRWPRRSPAHAGAGSTRSGSRVRSCPRVRRPDRGPQRRRRHRAADRSGRRSGGRTRPSRRGGRGRRSGRARQAGPEMSASSKVAIESRRRVAATTRPIASAAPVPSPSRRSRSSSGSRHSRARTTPWPGLHRAVAREQPRRELRREGAGQQGRGAGDEPVEHDRDAGPRRRRASARSGLRSPGRRPPRGRRSDRSAWVDASARARSIVAILCARPASSSPVPRPVTAATADPVRQATMALAAVVLPIPISPSPSSSMPSAARPSATTSPIPMERIGLVPGHRRPFAQVVGAEPQPHPEVGDVVDRLERGRWPGHADVEDHEPRPEARREDVDRGSAGQEVGDHLAWSPRADRRRRPVARPRDRQPRRRSPAGRRPEPAPR